MHARAAGPTVLRLALGVVFFGHGAQKLFGVWGGDGPTGTAAFFNQLGLTPAYPLALLVGIVELVGGLFLIAGLFTVPITAVLILTMAVAIWKVHFANGFFLNWKNAPGVGHGFEYNLVLIAGLVALMFTGPGALSFDSRRLQSAETEAAGRARLRAKGS
jgi:putative oxidoreductase